MTPFSPSARYYLYREPADIRKSFDGLCGLVEQGLGRFINSLAHRVFVVDTGSHQLHSNRSAELGKDAGVDRGHH